MICIMADDHDQEMSQTSCEQLVSKKILIKSTFWYVSKSKLRW